MTVAQIGQSIDSNKQAEDVDKSIPMPPAWSLEKLARGERIASEDLSQFAASLTPTKQLAEHGVRCVISLPLLAGGELLGVLNLGSREPIEMETDRGEIIGRIANELAIVIRQTRLQQEVQRYTSQLEQKVIISTATLTEC